MVLIIPVGFDCRKSYSIQNIILKQNLLKLTASARFLHCIQWWSSIGSREPALRISWAQRTDCLLPFELATGYPSLFCILLATVCKAKYNNLAHNIEHVAKCINKLKDKQITSNYMTT